MLTDKRTYSYGDLKKSDSILVFKDAPLTCYTHMRYKCYANPDDLHPGVAEKVEKAFNGWHDQINIVGIDEDGEFGVIDIYIKGIKRYHDNDRADYTELLYLLNKLELNQATPLYTGNFSPKKIKAIARHTGSDLMLRKQGRNYLYKL